MSKAGHQNTPPFLKDVFKIATWQRPAEGGATSLQSEKDQKKKMIMWSSTLHH